MQQAAPQWTNFGGWNVSIDTATSSLLEPLDQAVALLAAGVATDGRIVGHLAVASKLASGVITSLVDPYPNVMKYRKSHYSALSKATVTAVVGYITNINTALAVQQSIKDSRASTLAQIKAMAAVSR